MSYINVKNNNIKIISDILKLFQLKFKAVDSKILLTNSSSTVIVKEFNKKLTYTIAKEIWNNYTILIAFLEKINMTISNIDIETTYIINDRIIIPTGFFYKINNNNITISNIFDKSEPYISRELFNITTLPSNISYKSNYNSLAKFIIKNMFFVKTKLPDNLQQAITPIYATKLYWLLYWCLDIDPDNRLLLII